MGHSKNLLFTNDWLREILEVVEIELEKEGLKLDHVENLDSVFLNVLDTITPIASNNLVNALKYRGKEALKEFRKEIGFFETRLIELWGEAFDLLEMFLLLSREIGSAFNLEMRPSAVQNKDYTFDVLIRLQSRGCRVSQEILTLLRGGYADGAQARWRTLHEIAVVSLFISQHGDNVAEPYLRHHVIESYKAMMEYQKHARTLGYDLYTEVEVNELKSLRDELCKKYGKSFIKSYGWAADILGIENPHFSDIESSIKIDHLRPFYRMASHFVHANPKGITFNLGLTSRYNILLTGPSNAGMGDPGHNAAISLNQINSTLFNYKPSFQGIVLMKSMMQLVNEIDDAFYKVHKGLEVKREKEQATRRN